MNNVSVDTIEVARRIEALTAGLFFDDLGSERSAGIRACFLEADLKELTRQSFAQVVQLRPDQPADQFAQFEPAHKTLLNFVNNHQAFGLEQKAYQLVQLMQEHLKDLSVIVLGEVGDANLPAEHLTFVLGIGPDGNLAGFHTKVIWT